MRGSGALERLLDELDKIQKIPQGNDLNSSPRNCQIAVVFGILSLLIYLLSPNFAYLQMILASCASIALAAVGYYLTPKVKINTTLFKKAFTGFIPPLIVFFYMVAIKGPIWWNILGKPTEFNLTLEGVTFSVTGVVIAVLLSLSLPRIAVVGVLIRAAKRREEIVKRLKGLEIWMY